MISTNTLRAAFAAPLFLLVASCYSVDIQPGVVPCGAAGECPGDWECQVGHCYPVDFDGLYCETIVCDTHATCSEGPPPGCACNATFVGDGLTCQCPTGYELSGDTCVNIDECTTNTDNCATDATCADTDGSFTCTCNPGFMGDGVTCDDIPECMNSPCDVNATCTELPGSYSCACNPGFFGDGNRCYESIGQIIWMAHDLFSRNADVDRIIGNAVMQATTLDTIQVLGYDQYADLSIGGEAENTDAAINARLTEKGRTAVITRVSDFTNIPTMLGTADVLLVYEMENGGDPFTIGSLGAPYIIDFLNNGGIVIVMDHFTNGWQILNTAGVMRFIGNQTGYGDTPCTVRVPTDPVMADVTTPVYTGTNGTASYWTNDGTVLAVDSLGVPVVVHKNYSKPRFTGGFGSTWEMLANNTESGYSLMTYHPAHISDIYNMYDSTGQRYSPATNTWTPLSTVGPSSNPWFQLAPTGMYLHGWVAYTTALWRYNVNTDGWTNQATFAGGTNEYTMAATDEAGYVYGYVNNGNVIQYNPQNNGLAYYGTSIPALRGSGSLFETRLAYDPPTRSLYMGAFSTPDLYRFDLTTLATTQLSPIPEFQLNDIFCSDRSGHIYAAGDSGGTTMFQYTIATDTWVSIPDFPQDHSNNGSCVVSDDGHLYVSSGGTDLYRLPLD